MSFCHAFKLLVTSSAMHLTTDNSLLQSSGNYD